MAIRAVIRRYGAWLVTRSATLRWWMTRFFIWLGAIILIGTVLTLPQMGLTVDGQSTGWKIALGLTLGLATLVAGVGGNVVADRCVRWYDRRTPDVAQFFGNHDLTRLVGQSLAMVVRSCAGVAVDRCDKSALHALARRIESDWELVAQSPSGQETFAPLMESNLVEYVRDPHRGDLQTDVWLKLLQLFTEHGAPPAISHDRLWALAKMLNDRFGYALRMALKRDFALGGSAAVGIWLDISRGLLQQANGQLVLDDEAKQALAGVHHSLAEAAQLLDHQMNRHTRAVLSDVQSLRNWLDGRLDRIEGKIKGVQRSIDANAETLARLEQSAQRIEAFLAPKELGEDPRERKLPPELLEQAQELLERGSREQQALAKIALRQHDEADSIIQELKRQPLADAFRLLTLEGDNWYNAGQFDRAIEPYEQALALRPDDVGALNSVAIAHSQARLGSIEKHQKRAIELLEHAARLTKNAHPVDWAVTQDNLGNAWQRMPTGDRAENLRKAIAAHQAALEVYTRDAHLAEWAGTQNNLGIAWRNMPTGDRADNLRKAIAAYEAALEVRTREAHPVDWAITQNNLGVAWRNMPTGDRAENLRKAIAAYEAALEVGTREAHPVDWAMTQNNLAVALAAMAELPDDRPCVWLRRAVASGKAALTVYTAEAFPREHESTSRNLAIDRRAYEAAGCADEVPFDAIEPAE